jgi:glycosyltransferase involved in cell wall biosynthesis
MRIALNAWFNDQPTTGSGQYVRQLVPALRRADPSIEIEVVAPRIRNDAAKVWFEQVTFPRAAARMKADIAFVPYWAPPLQCSVPVVVTIHDVIPLALPAYRGGPLQRLYTSLVRAASPNATHILTDSEFSKQDIQRLLHVSADRITAIPLAAEERFTPAIPEEALQRVQERYRLPESYVFYLGGYDARKNAETLFQVYTWCAETIGQDFPLLMTGTSDTPAFAADGRAMTLGQMMQELELDAETVRFIGRPPEEDKPALYAGARCFLYTSTYEGFGLPALEALACGTPVVGSDASSIPEVVGNAGMLVNPFDARAMAGALIGVCTEDTLYQRLRERALLRSTQFSWQRTALETLAVFKAVNHRQ